MVGVRPEALTLSPNGPLKARLVRAEYQGASVLVRARLLSGQVVASELASDAPLPAEGEPVAFTVDVRCAHVFDAGSGARLDAALVPTGQGELRALA